jgi:hypothetical protein
MSLAGRTAGSKEGPMSRFFETRMGHTFYENTMPMIARELARLNGLLERVAVALEYRQPAGDQGDGQGRERGEEADDE